MSKPEFCLKLSCEFLQVFYDPFISHLNGMIKVFKDFIEYKLRIFIVGPYLVTLIVMLINSCLKEKPASLS